MSEKAMDRRSFLKGACFGVGGLAVATTGLAQPASAFADEWDSAKAAVEAGGKSGHVPAQWSFEVAPEPPTEDQIEETIECDILIMGAGVTAMPAAMFAARQGANVHVIEKGTTFGNKRFGTCAFNAKYQLDAGIKFKREEVLADAYAVSGGFQSRLDYWGMYFDHSGPTVDWVKSCLEPKNITIVPAVSSKNTWTDEEGKTWNAGTVNDPFWTGYQGFSQYAFIDPSKAEGIYPEWLEAMVEYAAENGAQFHYNMPGKQLITDEAGKVTGAYAYNNYTGKYVRFNTAKGVLLATGGIEGDKEMVAKYAPLALETINDWSMIETKNTGDGQKMAMWVGADHDRAALPGGFPYCTEIDAAKIRPSQIPIGHQLFWSPSLSSMPVLQTNIAGARFQNEALQFTFSSNGAWDQPEGKIWSLWDSAWEQKILPLWPLNPRDANCYSMFAIPDQAVMDQEVAIGITKRADSLEELAEICGFDKDMFLETVERYNALCAAGADEDFLKDAKWMTALDTPPYYAACTVSSLTGIIGGLKYDNHMRVVNKKGAPIHGLYCCGTVSGAFYGHAYASNITGCMMSHGQTFGVLAIKDMLGIEPEAEFPAAY